MQVPDGTALVHDDVLVQRVPLVEHRRPLGAARRQGDVAPAEAHEQHRRDQAEKDEALPSPRCPFLRRGFVPGGFLANAAAPGADEDQQGEAQ